MDRYDFSDVSGALKTVAELKRDKIYKHLSDLFLEEDTVMSAVLGLYGCSADTFGDVFRFVVRATYGRNRPFERIGPPNFMSDRVDIAPELLAGFDLTAPTVFHALNGLSNAGIIVRMGANGPRGGTVVYYAIDPKEVIKRTSPFRPGTPSFSRMYGHIYGSPDFRKLLKVVSDHSKCYVCDARDIMEPYKKLERRNALALANECREARA